MINLQAVRDRFRVLDQLAAARDDGPYRQNPPAPGHSRDVVYRRRWTDGWELGWGRETGRRHHVRYEWVYEACVAYYGGDHRLLLGWRVWRHLDEHAGGRYVESLWKPWDAWDLAELVAAAPFLAPVENYLADLTRRALTPLAVAGW